MNFIYITTNVKNGKQYVGSHNGEKDDKYLGSGRLFLKALNKYGQDSFKRKFIEECDSSLNLILEEKYINKYDTLIPNGYNISPTGGHGLNGKMSGETKRKIGLKNKGKIRSKETRQKISKACKGIQSGEKHPFFGKHHTLETLQKISENRKGQHCGEDHHYFGKKRNKKTREKISKSLKGRTIPEEVKKKLSAAAKNIKRIKCNHCDVEFTPWGLASHIKALKKNI